jgi:hypothetical protein
MYATTLVPRPTGRGVVGGGGGKGAIHTVLYKTVLRTFLWDKQGNVNTDTYGTLVI